MTETPLRSITNSGAWMPILVPTYATKIFIGQTFMTTYVVPFVCRYVTCPRFDRRYLYTLFNLVTGKSLYSFRNSHHPVINSLVTLCTL